MVLLLMIMIWTIGYMFTCGFVDTAMDEQNFFDWPQTLGRELRKRLDL